MVLSLISLVVIVGFVLLVSRGVRRARGPVVRSGRFRRLLAWLRPLLTEAEDRPRRRPSRGGGFGGFGGCGGGGGGGCGGGGGGGC